jgi:DNA-binding NarL/FixJ family response regulator
VVDDFAVWRHFVVGKLRGNPSFQVIGVASDGLEAVRKAEELKPDLILLDIGLAGLNGIEAARQLRKVAPESKILFLSQELDADVVQAAFSAGGHGYVLKSDAGSELFAGVEAVMSGKKFVSRNLTSKDLAEVVDSQSADPPGRDETVASTAGPLLVRREVARCHEVQFCSDDSLLLDGLTRFISAALKAGKAAIVIGTKSHRESLLEKLGADGLDIRGATVEGRYVALDVADTISSFMVNDMPDRVRFLKVIGDLISAASKHAKATDLPVAAWGECAPTLWAEGNSDAAIRVEELTNEIARVYDLEILCGFLLERRRSEEDSYTFRRICEEHSAVHSW